MPCETDVAGVPADMTLHARYRRILLAQMDEHVSSIHPTAVVSPEAHIGDDVNIGPFCVIEPDVEIADGCHLNANVTIKSGSHIGPENIFCEGSVIGGLPQHLRMPESVGDLWIGAGNIIREHVTINRGLGAGESTRIGNENMLMVGVHIAHDCVVGNHVLMTNNVLLAGHVLVEDHAYLGGAAAVHQFCRIGCYAMIGGMSRLIKDAPPFVTVDGATSRVVGLNTVGLRRNGFDTPLIRQLKAAYRVLYRSDLALEEALDKLEVDFQEEPVAHFHRFLRCSQRGITAERRPRHDDETFRIADFREDDDDFQRRAV
jgi:UDP-N-acetylglucosamine acyltransferase